MGLNGDPKGEISINSSNFKLIFRSFFNGWAGDSISGLCKNYFSDILVSDIFSVNKSSGRIGLSICLASSVISII